MCFHKALKIGSEFRTLYTCNGHYHVGPQMPHEIEEFGT